MQSRRSVTAGSSGRRGLSLMESLLFSALAVVVIGFAINVYLRGGIVTDEVQKSILLQQDIRAIVEFMSRDVNAAYWFLDEGPQARLHKLTVIKYGGYDVLPRLQENLGSGRGPDYPFLRMDGPVQNRMDAVKITYEWDQAKQQVLRSEEKGIFIMRTEASNLQMATFYDWQRQTVLKDKEILGANVKQFDLYYFGYERTRELQNSDRGSLKQMADLAWLQGQPDRVRYAHTACVLLRIKARYELGVYAAGKRHHVPETELVTKMWSLPKLRDEMYHEYWSSTDWDLLY